MSAPTLPAALADRAARGALAHAYILCAEDPGDLRAAAGAAAAAMVCQGETPPCGRCKDCQKAVKGVHPDVTTVAPEAGKDLTVGQIRALRQDVYIRPNEAKRKVYLLQDAHKMNPSAQNAFLKVLEDGPLYAAFLLLTPTPEALLPTVRSRCETILVSAREKAEDADLARKAGELAGLLLGTEEWRRIAWCAEHEKDKREDAAALLEETRKALLRYRNARTTPKAARLALLLQELTAQLGQNANVGCVWGRLWAEAGEN